MAKHQKWETKINPHSIIQTILLGCLFIVYCTYLGVVSKYDSSVFTHIHSKEIAALLLVLLNKCCTSNI